MNFKEFRMERIPKLVYNYAFYFSMIKRFFISAALAGIGARYVV